MSDASNEQLCAELRQGNRMALDLLVERNLPFVRRKAGALLEQLHRPDLLEEATQEGIIGIIEAARRYDPGYNNKYLTYAAHWVEKYIRQYLDAELREKALSLEEIVYGEESELQERQRDGDLWENGYVQSPEQICIHAETMAELRHALRMLPARDAAYLRYRYGLPDEDRNRTRKETAQHFHLSESRAKSTEALALEHLRAELPW